MYDGSIKTVQLKWPVTSFGYQKVNLLIKITHCVFPAWLERDVKILLLKHYNQ